MPYSFLSSPMYQLVPVRVSISSSERHISKKNICIYIPNFRSLPSHLALLHPLSPPRSHPDHTLFPHPRTHNRPSSSAPTAPCHHTTHPPTSREHARSVLARFCSSRRSHVGGRADIVGPGGCRAKRRRGDRPGIAHARTGRTRTERGKGVGGMDVGRVMFTVRSGQFEIRIERRGGQETMERGEPVAPSRCPINSSKIATYVRCYTGCFVQLEPHTRTAEISC
jgi:hypothetical protein